jgi:hypothetical protein
MRNVEVGGWTGSAGGRNTTLILWNPYGTPMESLWNSYGTTRQQHAYNTRGEGELPAALGQTEVHGQGKRQRSFVKNPGGCARILSRLGPVYGGAEGRIWG